MKKVVIVYVVFLGEIFVIEKKNENELKQWIQQQSNLVIV